MTKYHISADCHKITVFSGAQANEPSDSFGFLFDV